jgi:hypothetical protein
MPFRTKDFILFTVAVAFLLVGIIGTVARDITRVSGSNQASLINFVVDVAEYEAEVLLLDSNLDRPSNLASLKRAVEERMKTSQNQTVVSSPASDPPNVPLVTPAVRLPFLCSDYRPYNDFWSTDQLVFEVVEGARLLFRDVTTLESGATDLGDESSDLYRQAVLQLPLQSFPATKESCLATDVIGLALDGSLIRNNEFTLYGIFSEDTLVGYALDGFPIYGQTTRQTDECGGATMGGEYKYFIDKNREAVLNCFSGLPAALP